MIKTFSLSFLACILMSTLSAQTFTRKHQSLLFEQNEAQRSSGSFNYNLTTLSDPYTDLTGATSLNNGEIWDEPEYIVPVPFLFVMNGHAVTALQFMGSGSLLAAPTNDPDIFSIVFPFETDLIDRGAGTGSSLSPISYKVDGIPGNQILKIEFKNAGSYYEMEDNGTLEMYVNFQQWLYEGSNTIEFRFGPNFVDDPALFYGGDPGPYAGITDASIEEELFINPHFLSGDPANPTLSVPIATLLGTPANGTMYRLALILPLEIEVTGENSTSACAPNGTATVIASGGVEPYSYIWNNGAVTQMISNLDAGTYTVTVTDNDGATATGSVTITNVEPLLANAQSTDETGVGANNGTAWATPTGGLPPYAFEWNTGSTEQMIENLSPGVYTITVTDSEACTNVESVTVNAFGCPELTLETAIVNVSCFGLCDASLEIITVVNGTPPYAYLWSTGDVSSSLLDLCVGSYSVTVSDSDGCITSQTYDITQPDELHANTGSTSETAPGANDGTAWSAPTGGTSPYTYAWNNGSMDSLIIGLTPGEYSVIVTDAQFCTDTQSVVVDTFGCGLLEAHILHNSCFGFCDGSISVILFNTLEPVVYEWNNGDTTATITGLCSGTYSVTATDAAGCIVTSTFTIIGPSPVQANASSTDETGENTNDGTAWVTPEGGSPPYTYLWSTGSIDSLLVGLAPETYIVTVSDAQGCIDVDTVVINEFVCIMIQNVTAVNTSCFNSCDGSLSIAVSGEGPFEFSWSNGDTLSAIENLCAGIYSVSIYDAGQDCFGVPVTFEVTQPDSLSITIDEVINVTDTTISSISVSVTGGTMPYQYLWTGPGGLNLTTQDISDIPAGIYSLVVTDIMGCMTIIDTIEIQDETVNTSTAQDLEVRIFPNPANSEIFIEVEDILDFRIQLFYPDGRLAGVWHKANPIDISHLASGIYILRLLSGEKFSVLRIIIQ